MQNILVLVLALSVRLLRVVFATIFPLSDGCTGFRFLQDTNFKTTHYTTIKRRRTRGQEPNESNRKPH